MKLLEGWKSRQRRTGCNRFLTSTSAIIASLKTNKKRLYNSMLDKIPSLIRFWRDVIAPLIMQLVLSKLGDSPLVSQGIRQHSTLITGCTSDAFLNLDSRLGR
jgi:hypothetical protein